MSRIYNRKTIWLSLPAQVLWAAALLAQPAPPPTAVEVTAAVEEELAATSWVPGTVVSRNDAVIAAEEAGQLTWVADVGDEFERGAVVARINDRALRLQLESDDANVRRLAANREYLDQQVERLERLSREQVVAADQLENMVSQKEAAGQALAAAEVAREQTRYRLSRCLVKAPFPGRVVERVAPPGGFVSVGGPIVRLVDVGDVEVRAQAPLTVEPFLAEGMKVAVKDRARDGDGTIRRVIRVGDERSRMFEVRVALDSDPWVVGSALRVALPASAPRRVVAVPRDALILRSSGVYLFKVGGEGTAERIAVETGVGDDDLIEVVGDVEAGDRVVVRGGERLREGQAVRVTERAS